MRDAALLLVAVGLSYWVQAELVQRGLVSSDDQTIYVVRIICGLLALVAVFSGVFVLEVLFLTPRALWREAKAEIAVLSERIAALEQALAPRISFGRIVRDDLDFEGVGKSSERYTIEVVNAGNTMLENCAVAVRRVTFGGRRKPIELNGALVLVTRDHDGRSVSFGLRPGVPKQLLLITRDASDVPNRSPYLLRNEVINFPLEAGQSGTVELVAGCEIGRPTRLTIGWAVAQSTYDLTLEKGIENEQSDVVAQAPAEPLDFVHQVPQL